MHIQSIIRQINKDLVPQFEDKLRTHLHLQEKDWLIEQIVRLTLDAHSLQENDRRQYLRNKEIQRTERMTRLREMNLNIEFLREFLGEWHNTQREYLITNGFLLSSAPEKGTDLISESRRTAKGNALLLLAKDVLFGLLFGDEHCNVLLDRIEREMLTLTLPRAKAHAIDFMKATTELSALGTWQDPDSVSNDARADNVILEVEFGEVAGELVGDGVITTLSLINNLEVNEQILYGRMINIEQSTLIG